MNATSTSQNLPPTATPDEGYALPKTRTMHPVVAFIIGLAIILGASLMNAGGLNLTKLDHLRQAALPKSSRKHEWARPLWLLGMLLYMCVSPFSYQP